MPHEYIDFCCTLSRVWFSTWGAMSLGLVWQRPFTHCCGWCWDQEYGTKCAVRWTSWAVGHSYEELKDRNHESEGRMNGSRRRIKATTWEGWHLGLPLTGMSWLNIYEELFKAQAWSNTSNLMTHKYEQFHWLVHNCLAQFLYHQSFILNILLRNMQSNVNNE